MDAIDNFNLKNDESLYQFLSSAVEQSFEGIAVADLEGTLTYVNPAWAKMHGYESGEELVGQSLKIFHNDEQLEKDVLNFNEIVKEKGAHTGEVENTFVYRIPAAAKPSTFGVRTFSAP